MNSHIIPEFVYSCLYDEKHRFQEISFDSKKKNKFLQKGHRERLFCSECEQLFSKYERYASLVLNGGYRIEARNEGRLIHLNGFQYPKFKLFALSILWRSGVSNLDVFDQVQLGLHLDKIRNMLLDENPGSQQVYPFILSPVIHKNELQEGLIVKPTWTRVENHFAYRFVFGGIAWVFIVSSHKAPQEIIRASISESCELTMLPWELSDMKFIVSMAQKLIGLGKL